MVKEKKEIRRYRRFYGYDYSRGAALFITIVTNPRRRLFGAIINAKLQKTPLGLAVDRRSAEMVQMPGIRLFMDIAFCARLSADERGGCGDRHERQHHGRSSAVLF